MSLQQLGGKLLKELEMIDLTGEFRVFSDQPGNQDSAWWYTVLAAGGLVEEVGRGEQWVDYVITDKGRAMQAMIDEGQPAIPAPVPAVTDGGDDDR